MSAESRIHHGVRPTYTPKTQGKTKQSEANDADITTIVKRWKSTGQMPMVNTKEPFYGDFTTGLDFETQLNRTIDATTAFNALPAAVRRYCHNDVAEFIEAMSDTDDLANMIEHGLRVDEPTQKAIDIYNKSLEPEEETPTPKTSPPKDLEEVVEPEAQPQ